MFRNFVQTCITPSQWPAIVTRTKSNFCRINRECSSTNLLKGISLCWTSSLRLINLCKLLLILFNQIPMRWSWSASWSPSANRPKSWSMPTHTLLSILTSLLNYTEILTWRLTIHWKQAASQQICLKNMMRAPTGSLNILILSEWGNRCQQQPRRRLRKWLSNILFKPSRCPTRSRPRSTDRDLPSLKRSPRRRKSSTISTVKCSTHPA